MIRLTKQQIAILESAHTQPGGFATLPGNMKPAAAAKVAISLIEQGLARELRAKDGAPIWRDSEDGRSYSLKILKAGRAAVEAVALPATKDSCEAPKADYATAASDVGRKQSAERSRSPLDAVVTKVPTKRALILSMMGRKGGATLDELIAATGWLPHTTRATLTGLRKAGVLIGRDRDEARGVSVYRILPTMLAAA